jgi:7,8-dihydropterin-6-yl-methyl-4-(beta-D-ribofuranosyl)aminobenzene 5'-phosphate synthase
MDHSGALPEVAAMIAEARAASATAAPSAAGGAAGAESPAAPPPAVFDVHPCRPHQRGMMGADRKPVPWNPDPELKELEVAGATVVQQHAEAHTLCGGCFYVSGAIPRVTSYEQGNPTNASQFVSARQGRAGRTMGRFPA